MKKRVMFAVGSALGTLSLSTVLLAGCNGKSGQATAPQKVDKPRLVLQITVDQTRGDLPTRYADRLGEGGLRYLLEEGIHYNNAHHGHANTETIVGHVTLATGAHSAAYGMIGDIWFDRTTGGKAKIWWRDMPVRPCGSRSRRTSS